MLPVTKNAIAILIFGLLTTVKAKDCIKRDFGYGSVVCVCNSTYCDSATVNVPEKGRYRSYESNKAGKRMYQKVGTFDRNTNESENESTITIVLNPDEKFQTIHGFGGAFTDSTGFNMEKLSVGCQDRIIESYFGSKGNRYNLGRVPIGGTDFSSRAYSYDDYKDDVTLKHFSLAKEDYLFKIPVMKKALAMNPCLKFVSATWSPPPWMKTNNQYYGYGFLKQEYYQTYADYVLKFLTAYKQEGLPIWAVSTGNEPDDAFVPFGELSSMGWTPQTMAKWVAENLGPTLALSESNDTIILMLDDQRFNLPWYIIDAYSNSVAKSYTAGIAVHWYADWLITHKLLDVTHDLYPDKFIIQTEACVGSFPWELPKVRLGDWSRGEQFIADIMESLNHWITGWMEWNLVLDKTGGPTWIKNFVDASVIVNPETDEFFKQPMFYAVGHFSKFLSRGSTRIGATKTSQVSSVAFLTPGNEIVVVLFNRNDKAKDIKVKDPQEGNISMKLSPSSITTIIYKR